MICHLIGIFRRSSRNRLHEDDVDILLVIRMLGNIREENRRRVVLHTIELVGICVVTLQSHRLLSELLSIWRINTGLDVSENIH